MVVPDLGVVDPTRAAARSTQPGRATDTVPTLGVIPRDVPGRDPFASGGVLVVPRAMTFDGRARGDDGRLVEPLARDLHPDGEPVDEPGRD